MDIIVVNKKDEGKNYIEYISSGEIIFAFPSFNIFKPSVISSNFNITIA